jgi:hypothetical protein
VSTPFTTADLEAFYDLQNRFDEAIHSALDEYAALTDQADDAKHCGDITDYGSGADSTINIEGDEYWRYGGHEHHNVRMPVKFVVDEGYRATLRAEVARKRQEKEEAAAKAAVEKEAAAQEKRRQQFETLKKEFAA